MNSIHWSLAFAIFIIPSKGSYDANRDAFISYKLFNDSLFFCRICFWSLELSDFPLNIRLTNILFRWYDHPITGKWFIFFVDVKKLFLPFFYQNLFQKKELERSTRFESSWMEIQNCKKNLIFNQIFFSNQSNNESGFLTMLNIDFGFAKIFNLCLPSFCLRVLVVFINFLKHYRWFHLFTPLFFIDVFKKKFYTLILELDFFRTKCIKLRHIAGYFVSKCLNFLFVSGEVCRWECVLWISAVVYRPEVCDFERWYSFWTI